ncbi:hypothetical protein ISCGN_020748 [Ixodes scapularis]
MAPAMACLPARRRLCIILNGLCSSLRRSSVPCVPSICAFCCIMFGRLCINQGGACESRCLESGVSTDPEPCRFARPRLAVRGFPVSGEKGTLVVEPSRGGPAPCSESRATQVFPEILAADCRAPAPRQEQRLLPPVSGGSTRAAPPSRDRPAAAALATSRRLPPGETERASRCCSLERAPYRRHQNVHTGERPHECAECGQKFAQPADLRRHESTHSGERPHVCPECGRGFVERGHLSRHRQTHSGEKPYACHLCCYRASDLSSVTRHLIGAHSKEYPHKCGDCGKGFLSPGELGSHMRRQHACGDQKQ